MSKVGIVATGIATDLAAMQVGDRMPKVQDTAARYEVGNGTVQAALSLLEDTGAVDLRARGRLGTFVAAIDHPLLWEMAGGRSVSVAMPLPYSRRYEGLATGLQRSFGDVGLPLTLMFMRGSAHRSRAAREGRADLAVMSQLAADEQSDLRVVQDYGPKSYVGDHGLVVTRGRDPKDPTLRIGVDVTSVDQVAMTQRHFGPIDAARLVEVSYNQLDRCFATGVVEATIWNLDEVDAHISTPIDTHPIRGSGGGSNTRAVVVSAAGDARTPLLVSTALASDAVTRTAAEVVRGDLIPSY